jgi:hypothetical protein
MENLHSFSILRCRGTMCRATVPFCYTKATPSSVPTPSPTPISPANPTSSDIGGAGSHLDNNTNFYLSFVDRIGHRRDGGGGGLTGHVRMGGGDSGWSVLSQDMLEVEDTRLRVDH